jgi:hypothetical protein
MALTGRLGKTVRYTVDIKFRKMTLIIALEIQSPVRSPSSEETFQFGGYMPSSAGRKSRGNTRPDSEMGRRSVKFSDGLGLDDDMFSSKKRPSTAPGSRRKKDEPKDPLNNTFTAPSNKGNFKKQFCLRICKKGNPRGQGGSLPQTPRSKGGPTARKVLNIL